MRMAKEAVRHGRGRASRTALAGGVRGQLGHGLVSVCVDASTISANDYINLSIILIKVIITWVVIEDIFWCFLGNLGSNLT